MRAVNGSVWEEKLFWWVMFPSELILSTAEVICLKKFMSYDIENIK